MCTKIGLYLGKVTVPVDLDFAGVYPSDQRAFNPNESRVVNGKARPTGEFLHSSKHYLFEHGMHSF